MKQLADPMSISRPAVSRHLRLLKDAGLVVDRPKGARNVYALSDSGANEVRAFMEEIWGVALARFRLFVENTPD